MGKKRKKRCYCGIGGQAVLEGVMMKNQDSYAVAVRRPDGEIELKKEDYKGIWGDKKITKIPFLRGVFNFIDSLVLGMSTLTWSAQFFEEDEPEKNIADQKKKAKKPEQKETVSDAVTENVDGKADATDTKEKIRRGRKHCSRRNGCAVDSDGSCNFYRAAVFSEHAVFPLCAE